MAAKMKGKVEIAQQLERIDPGLEVAVFTPEQCRVRSNRVEKLPILRVARQGELAGRSLAVIELGIGRRREHNNAENQQCKRQQEGSAFVHDRPRGVYAITCVTFKSVGIPFHAPPISTTDVHGLGFLLFRNPRYP